MSHFRSQVVFLGVPGTPWYMTLKGGSGLVTNLQWATAMTALVADIASGITGEVSVNWDGVIDTLDDSTEVLEDSAAVGGTTVYGANVADPLPYANQLLIRLGTDGIVTGPTGRTTRVRGKIFVPGLCENQTTGGIFQPAVRDQVLEWFTQFDSAVGMVVYSPTGQATFPTTSTSGVLTPAVLRSRRD